MIKDLIRPEIRNFIPYNANQIPYDVKLDANESPFALSASVRQKLAKYILEDGSLNLYPDTDSIELRKAIAEYWKIDMDQVVAGVGSDQIILLLVSIFVNKGDAVVYPSPSFGMYSLTTLAAGGKPVEISLKAENGFLYDASEFIEKANKEKAKLVFLCTPNNPTGNAIPKEDMVRIAEGCRNSVIVIDEAYAEFAEETAVSLIDKYENVIVLRTFSKAYGLAGLRCGYSLSGRELADELNKVKPPYNLSTFTQLAARAVLEDEEENSKRIGEIKVQRDFLIKGLQKIAGVTVYASQANFILIGISNARATAKALADKRVLVRAFGQDSVLKNFIRISVGNEEQNITLLNTLISVQNELRNMQ